MLKRTLASLSAALCAALIAGACATRPVKKSTASDQASVSKSTSSVEGSYTPGVDVTEASLRGSDFSAAEGLETIYFDYDSSSLKPAALDGLKKNAEYLKSHPDQDVLVAGYCDQRGTIEYNLALGQKRAREVRDYYIRLGVPGKSVATISYGKENLVCSEATDECWAKNRRGETRIRPRTASNGKPHHSATP